jgi:hypothetical protein
MADLWDKQVLPDKWPEPLRQIFAQAGLSPAQAIRDDYAKVCVFGYELVGLAKRSSTTKHQLATFVLSSVPNGQDRFSDKNVLLEHGCG